jgi:hypothetical protein
MLLLLLKGSPRYLTGGTLSGCVLLFKHTKSNYDLYKVPYWPLYLPQSKHVTEHDGSCQQPVRSTHSLRKGLVLLLLLLFLQAEMHCICSC